MKYTKLLHNREYYQNKKTAWNMRTHLKVTYLVRQALKIKIYKRHIQLNCKKFDLNIDRRTELSFLEVTSKWPTVK